MSTQEWLATQDARDKAAGTGNYKKADGQDSWLGALAGIKQKKAPWKLSW